MVVLWNFKDFHVSNQLPFILITPVWMYCTIGLKELGSWFVFSETTKADKKELLIYPNVKKRKIKQIAIIEIAKPTKWGVKQWNLRFMSSFNDSRLVQKPCHHEKKTNVRYYITVKHGVLQATSVKVN